MASLGWAVVPDVVQRIATSSPLPCATSASNAPGWRSNSSRPSACKPLPGDQPGIVVIGHAAFVMVDDQPQVRALELEQLVDLLLVLAQHGGHTGGVTQVASLGRQHILVDAERHAAERLGRKLAPDPVRPVAADQGHALAATHAQRLQSERNEPDLVTTLGPGVDAPDAELFFPHRDFAGPVGRIVQEPLGRVSRNPATGSDIGLTGYRTTNVRPFRLTTRTQRAFPRSWLPPPTKPIPIRALPAGQHQDCGAPACGREARLALRQPFCVYRQTAAGGKFQST